jgi:mycothiol system anti-sigma-R factor
MEHDDSAAGGLGVDCNDAVRQLYVFLDGELTDERRHDIATHLDDCGSCAKAAGFEAELRVVIASRCQERVPQALIERVAAALAKEEAASRRSSGGS